MPQFSPTAEGLRALFRRPSLAVAEIAWRWAFGAAACLLVTLTVVEYLDTLPVTAGAMLFLRSRQPFLISEAIAHILAGSARGLVAATLVLVPGLTVFWIIASSIGRVATLKPLLDYFRLGESPQPAPVVRFSGGREEKRGLRSIAALNFLRVALALAALLGIFGAAMVAAFASSEAHPRPGLAFLIFLPLALLVVLLWSPLNWFLSLAPVFVLHQGEDAFGSMSVALKFCRSRAGPVFWSSTAFAFVHLVVFLAAACVICFPLAFIGLLPSGIILGAILLLTMVYLSVVDFFYLGRLAAYVYILKTR